MLNDWLYLAIFMAISLILPTAAIVIASLLSPKKPDESKNETYECGVETVGSTWVQFKPQYYVYGLAFLVFDVETIFLYPFAVAFKEISLFAVSEGVLFILILLGGLLYAWRKGALEWI